MTGFDVPKLAGTIEGSSPEAIGSLPCGVNKLDAQRAVRVFNRTEARLCGYGSRPAPGKHFFREMAPCMNNAFFRERIEKALERGRRDIEFTYTGGSGGRNWELTVRVHPASDGGIRIFHQRNADG